MMYFFMETVGCCILICLTFIWHGRSRNRSSEVVIFIIGKGFFTPRIPVLPFWLRFGSNARWCQPHLLTVWELEELVTLPSTRVTSLLTNTKAILPWASALFALSRLNYGICEALGRLWSADLRGAGAWSEGANRTGEWLVCLWAKSVHDPTTSRCSYGTGEVHISFGEFERKTV